MSTNATAAQLACDALRAYLLASLPAQVTLRNADRAAELITPQAGPWTIPAAAAVSVTVDGTTFLPAALTSGSRTASQLATEINTATGLTAFSATTDGRLKFLSPTAPSSPSTNSVVGYAADATNTLTALGFDTSGEMVVRSPLVAPTNQGVMDGEPKVLPPLANGRMIIMLGDREDARFQSSRRDEREARIAMHVFVPVTGTEGNADREMIQSAVACVANVLFSASGRQFATAGASQEWSIGYTDIVSSKVAGSTFKTPSDLSYLFEQARLIATARVFQRTT